jgi:hypothetical protein
MRSDNDGMDSTPALPVFCGPRNLCKHNHIALALLAEAGFMT